MNNKTKLGGELLNLLRGKNFLTCEVINKPEIYTMIFKTDYDCKNNWFKVEFIVPKETDNLPIVFFNFEKQIDGDCIKKEKISITELKNLCDSIPVQK